MSSKTTYELRTSDISWKLLVLPTDVPASGEDEYLRFHTTAPASGVYRCETSRPITALQQACIKYYELSKHLFAITVV